MVGVNERRLDELEGPAAAPRKNGELVFQALWEGRAFGMAVAMSDRGFYAWNDFRDRLVDAIASADAHDSESTYYERWLASFEAIVIDGGFITHEELDVRTAEYETGEHDDDDD